MPINYMQMLLDLMEERQKWQSQRDEAIREISRLSELIRATMNMIPAEQIARYEPIFERLENRPAGLSMAIRACFTGGATFATLWAERGKAERASPAEGGRGTGREAEGGREAGREAEEGRLETTATGSEKDAAWLTPVEIRDALKRMGFPFENYKANPLASIHTTLKRMVPAEMETKTLKDGQRVYRLKSAGEWTQAFAEVRQWLRGSYSVVESAGNAVAVRRNKKKRKIRRPRTILRRKERNVERLEAHRAFFASLITTQAGVPNGRLTAAFAATPRERFLGPGPWKIFTGGGYITTPTSDPAFLYQDVTVALSEAGKINNGQPVLHAVGLSTLNPQEGETAVHIGAGTGYYTAVLSRLVEPTGKVLAYEIEPTLAERATANLADMPNVVVYQRSGAEGPLPACNLIYVNAGATAPLDVWLDALLPGGRLLFPLTPDGPGGTPGAGGMLLITRVPPDRYNARFVMPVMFIPCLGARDDETAKKLAEAFKRGDSRDVRSLRRKMLPDDTCWCAGNGWWLSTAENA